MSKPSLVVVLVEDAAQQRFIYRALLAMSYQRHDIHFVALPSGAGAGEQYVRTHYAQQVAAIRRRHGASALVVAIDADKLTARDREAQLHSALLESQKPARDPNEKIVHLIPKRNIETWMGFFGGVDVDEESDWKGRVECGTAATKEAAIQFVELARGARQAPPGLPSLRNGITEWRRLT